MLFITSFSSAYFLLNHDVASGSINVVG